LGRLGELPLAELIGRWLPTGRYAATPLRRYAQPLEIAQAVLFRASNASSYVTGAVLVMGGGGLG